MTTPTPEAPLTALQEALDHIELYPTHDEGCPWTTWKPESRTFRVCVCSHIRLVSRLRAALARPSVPVVVADPEGVRRRWEALDD